MLTGFLALSHKHSLKETGLSGPLHHPLDESTNESVSNNGELFLTAAVWLF